MARASYIERTWDDDLLKLKEVRAEYDAVFPNGDELLKAYEELNTHRSVQHKVSSKLNEAEKDFRRGANELGGPYLEAIQEKYNLRF